MERDLNFSFGFNENGVLYVPYREVMKQIEKSYGNGFNDGMAKGSIGNDEEDIRADERAKVIEKVLSSEKFFGNYIDARDLIEWLKEHK